MTTFSLGQEWITKTTNSEIEDIPVVGADISQLPTSSAVNELFGLLARSETAREIARRKWIIPKSVSIKEKINERSKALYEFLITRKHAIPRHAMYRGRRPSVRRGVIDELATRAWIIHIADKAKEQQFKVKYKSSLLNNEFVSNLISKSTLEDGPRRAIEAVKGIGIRVAIERGLPGMSVDGVSFHTKQLGPVIALTLRYDKLDNFWFTLMHELGHIALHLDKPSEVVFVDSDEEESDELEQEAEANAFAKDSLIPRDIWHRSDARRLATKKSVIELANQLGIHTSVVAGRIHYERRDFKLFPQLVGQGEVRHLFV